MEAKRLPGGYLAYRMMEHCILEHGSLDPCEDVTADRYDTSEATMPGPTIVVTEEDEIEIELFYAISNPEDPTQEHVSLHVHGVHYDILSDGTLKYINLVKDESAIPVMSYIYRWDAAVGTAGSWAYHDHNFNTHNGAEDRGLYGALIVNPISGVVDAIKNYKRRSVAVDDITKDFVLYVLDDTFMGMEIDNTNNHYQTPLFDNPTFSAPKNTLVRFHLIALGTNPHKFRLRNYEWIDPDTRQLIDIKRIGSLEKHVFTIQANRNARYLDNTFTSRLLKMKGKLQVN
jgi:FtsP/CotA-like multicopper oxidase with cupredoxin domain